MKSVNEFIRDWVKKSSDPSIPEVDTVAQDVLKHVEKYNCELTWDQIDILESALGDLVTNRYHKKDSNAEFLSIVGFIIACGTANKK